MTTVSYASGISSEPLIGETIGGCLRRTARRAGDREALVDVPSGRRWTYRELDDEVDTLARALLGLGVGPGDRVGIWSPNRPEWVLVQYATARIGAILVTINPAYRTHELTYVLNQAGVSTLISAESFRTSDYRAMISEASPACHSLRTVIYLGTSDWTTLLAQARTVEPAELAGHEAALSFDDPINIQYTSGTTGFPKGATLSHHNILNNGYFVARRQGWSDQDRVCLPVPFYHCFGSVIGNLGAVTHGACVVIPAPFFEPGATLEAVQQERCTVAVRRADDVHRRAGAPGVRRLRPVQPAHRGDGRLALPGRGDEAGDQRDGHGRGDDLLRHDRDIAGLHPDPRATTTWSGACPRSARCCPHVEVKIVDPDTGLTVPRGDAGRVLHPGLLGHARLLGDAGPDRRGRSTRPAGCTPATSR